MSLIEVVMAMALFVVTAGSVVDMWTVSVHAATEVHLQRAVDDLAEQYAERVTSGELQAVDGQEWTYTDEYGLVFTVVMKGTVGDGQEITVSSGEMHQSLQVSVPR